MRRYDPAPGPAPVIGELVAREQRLEVWCCICRHEILMPPEEAVRLLGAKTTFPAAARKLVCSACGAQGREGLVRCRGSIEDFYARLARDSGMPLPTHRGSSGPPREGLPADSMTPRRSHPRPRRRR